MSTKKRVYVVEDEVVVARTLCLILERAGYEVSMFLNAEVALAAIHKSQPDLVLSDVVMTGPMNGLQLAETIAYEYPSVRIILISGQAQTSELLDGFHARGLSPYVHSKPIAPQRLLDKIAEALRGESQVE